MTTTNPPTRAVNVTAIAFTGYPITNLPRARAFYEGLLGLIPATTFEHENTAWIEYDLGASTLAISNMSADMWKPSPNGPTIALEVSEFDEAIAVLKDAGVPFLIEPMDSGVCRMAIVADPDGNSLVIHQRHPAKS
jgi:predicted enzyme related to lactoylglutathione lyase